MSARLLPVLAVISLLAACGGEQPAPQAATSPPASPSASAPASAAASAPAAGAASADAPLPDPIATAMGRVRAMIDAVDDAKIKEAFSPDFLAKVPPAQITQVFTEVHKSFGACTGQTPLALKGTTQAHLLVTCEHGKLDAKVAVDANAPYLIQGLLIRPAQD
jgi:pyruvate/2-oxoglutarate dehydrogenase complex dihydrolipoamide acyltransferase (E2) component